AALEERRRIARELHDGVAQELAFVATQARLFVTNPSAVEIKYLGAAAERALEESRRAIALLAHPTEESLDAAIVETVEELTSRWLASARAVPSSAEASPSAPRRPTQTKQWGRPSRSSPTSVSSTSGCPAAESGRPRRLPSSFLSARS